MGCVEEAGGGGPACPRELLRNRSGLCCALRKQPNQASPTTWQTGQKCTGVGLFGAHQDGPDGFKKSTRCLVTVRWKPHFDRRPRAWDITRRLRSKNCSVLGRCDNRYTTETVEHWKWQYIKTTKFKRLSLDLEVFFKFISRAKRKLKKIFF